MKVIDHGGCIFQRKRSEIMSRVRSKGNRATEEKLKSLFRANGIKGWRRGYRLLEAPTLYFPKRIAVFVDGEFWHGHPTLGQIPETNTEFWVKKLKETKRGTFWLTRHWNKKAG